MKFVLRLLVFYNLATSVATSPLPPDLPESHVDVAPKSPIIKRGFREAYRGIHWDDALLQCSTDEFDIILEATRMALDVTSYFMTREWESVAWHRYFVKPWKANSLWDWHSSQRNHDLFLNIHDNMYQVSQFPRKGKKDRKGNWSRYKQTSYRCHDVEGYHKCALAPDEHGIWHGESAYTADGSASLDGWAVVFCPRFFKDGQLKYINRITDVIDVDERDIPDFPNGRMVYGERLSHNFAWKHMGTRDYPGGAINADVAFNVLPGVADDGGPYDGAVEMDDGEFDTADVDLDKIEVFVPINAHSDEDDDKSPEAVINYVGEDYDDFVEDSKEPFVAPNSNCILS
ncbi:hypothetical protein F4779DRAFT_618968 [Xylariaceae sp. FL0662B]|nr:hypothetical protein F4779DRAFT_618968 [Xylariaceae sp. FL0662B]